MTKSTKETTEYQILMFSHFCIFKYIATIPFFSYLSRN